MVTEEEEAIAEGAVTREGMLRADAMLRRHWRKVYGESDMGKWHNRQERLRTPRSRAFGEDEPEREPQVLVVSVRFNSDGDAAAVSEASSRGARQSGRRDWI
jgi:hypothetical protein